MSSSPETTWLQERKLSYNKIGQPLNGLLNLILLFVVGEIFWYVLFSPNGVFQLYTPNVGQAFVITCLMVVHWLNDVCDFSVVSRPWLRDKPVLVKGTIMSAGIILLALVIMLVFYNQIIGLFGPIFFSGDGLMSTEGLGQYAQTARENA